MRIGVHAVPGLLVQVLDKAEVEWPSAVLVTLEFSDRSLRGFGRIESDYSASSRSSAGLILYLGLLHFANGSEQLDEVVVAC